MSVYDVPLIPQQTAISCWAASVTMIQSWAQQASIDPGALTDIPGFQDAYESAGLDLTTASKALTTWGLTTEPPQDFSAQGFSDLLDNFGPVFIAVNVGTESRIANHARVIAGFDLDRDLVYVNDPWGANMPRFVPSNPGAQYTISYDTLLNQLDSLARAIYQGIGQTDPGSQLANLAFIAHLQQKPAGL
jgi:hypothetical protein